MNEPIEPGGWQVPRWMGCDPRLMILLFFAAFLAFVSHNTAFIIFASIGIIGAAIGFSYMFEIEPRQLDIIVANRSLLGIKELDQTPTTKHATVRLPRYD